MPGPLGPADPGGLRAARDHAGHVDVGGVDQRLEVGALAGDEDADPQRRVTPSPSTTRPATNPGVPPRSSAVSAIVGRLGHDDAREAEAHVEDPPHLVVLDPERGQPAEHRLALPRAGVDLGAEAVRELAGEVARDAAAGDVRHAADVDGPRQLGDRAGVDRGRLEQRVGDGRAAELGRRVVEPGARPLEQTADEREAVRVRAARRQPEDRVAGLDPARPTRARAARTRRRRSRRCRTRRAPSSRGARRSRRPGGRSRRAGSPRRRPRRARRRGRDRSGRT